MAYDADSKTIALYDLDAGGTNIAGDSAWDLTALGDGTYSLEATDDHLVRFQSSDDWTIEREVQISSAPGTILELAGWGESEVSNIQIVVGWDDERRLYVGWERGAGTDFRLRSDVALPLDAPLRIAVVRSGPTISLWANGTRLAQRRLPGPTGGSAGGSVAPGLTLSVGRRVSTSDPQIYAGGGWLRISTARTAEEIVADWRASYTPPTSAITSWEDLARREPRRTYYAFRGSYRSGAQVAWGTAAVHTASGPVEDRLVGMPAPIVRGIPEQPGAMPERVSTSIVVANADGALDVAFAGGVDAAAAHEGDSILNLRGKLYLGIVGPDGMGVERALTPTLAVIGSPTIDGSRQLTLNLATDDSATLGPIDRFVTVDQLRRAEVLDNGSAAPLGRNDRDPSPIDWQDASARISENLCVVVPWAYGVSPIPLIHVGEKFFVACVVRYEPAISEGAWELSREQSSANAREVEDLEPTLWTLQLRVPMDDDSTVDLWVVGVTMDGATEEQLDGEWFLTPEPEAHFGMPSGVRATPAAILRQIVSDLSAGGASGIDTSSFDRVVDEVTVSGACGGLIRSGASIAEIAAHIVDPWGIALWIDTDDRLRAMRPTGWSSQDATDAAGDLPEITAADVVEGSFTVRQPAPTEVGGASVRTSIDWTSEQTKYFLPQQLLRHAPGATQLALVGEPESRMSGAWVYPPAAETALQSVGSRRAWVYTRISASLPPWILQYELGQMFRLSHPFGPASGGYQRRLVRLIRMEHAPGEDAVMCEFLDMQALADMRVGVLDSAENWVYHRPGSGRFLQFVSGSAVVRCGDPNANTDWIGRSLWTFGAPVAALRRSWRIVDVDVDFGTLTLDRAADVTAAFSSDGSAPAHRAPWIVMRNRRSDPDHRPQYITLADEETGQHSDGSEAYRFTA